VLVTPSGGIVEGINNKLKLIKRSGFGFRNFDNFRIISLISWNLHNEFTWLFLKSQLN
jgi:hypothetical protein